MIGLDGELSFSRRRYRCGGCGREFYPCDLLLGLGDGSLSPPLAKRACQLGNREGFQSLSQLLTAQHGVRVPAKSLQRLMHAAGGVARQDHLQPVEQFFQTEPAQRSYPACSSPPDRLYVSCDGIMFCTNQMEPDPEHPGQQRLGWREMKVGCVYWQERGGRWRKRLIYGMEDPQAFGRKLWYLACECGYRQARQRIFAADGGPWCWGIAQRHFQQATWILDWYHASEHVWQTAAALYPADRCQAAAWAHHCLELMRNQGGAGLLAHLKQSLRQRQNQAADLTALGKLIDYVCNHLPQMDYPGYRASGYAIGTGMMESTARQLVGLRLKGPGMHWSQEGALAVTALRATELNGQWDQFWASNPLQRAA